MLYDVYFFEIFEEEKIGILKYLPESINVGFSKETVQESGIKNIPSSVISIRTQSEIPPDWLGNLQAIFSRSTGYDHLISMMESITYKNIQFGYLPVYCSKSVAEQAILGLISLLKKWPLQIHQMKDFNRSGLTGNEWWGHKVLIVGVGNIGKEIYSYANAMGMKVKGVDLYHRFKEVDYTDLYLGLKWANSVVCAMNLTTRNHSMLDADCLRLLNKGSFLVNISRGEITPASSLIELIKEEVLAGIYLDVYECESDLGPFLRKGRASNSDEYIKDTLNLLNLPQVIATPHNAFNSKQSLDRKCKDSVKQIRHFLDKKEFYWEVAYDN